MCAGLSDARTRSKAISSGKRNELVNNPDIARQFQKTFAHCSALFEVDFAHEQ